MSGTDCISVPDTVTDAIYGGSSIQDAIAIEVSALRGDFDGDDTYTTDDIDLLTVEIATGSTNLTYDLNADGAITLADQDEWLTIAGHAKLGPGVSYLNGDANLDGDVDGVDFGRWNSSKFTNATAWSAGDFNASGYVDGFDFGIWNAHKFTSANASSVPEPAGLSVVFLLAISTAARRAD